MRWALGLGCCSGIVAVDRNAPWHLAAQKMEGWREFLGAEATSSYPLSTFLTAFFYPSSSFPVSYLCLFSFPLFLIPLSSFWIYVISVVPPLGVCINKTEDVSIRLRHVCKDIRRSTVYHGHNLEGTQVSMNKSLVPFPCHSSEAILFSWPMCTHSSLYLRSDCRLVGTSYL